MRLAYNNIEKFIQKKLQEKKSDGERIELLELYCTSFFENFYVVMISALKRQDAFTIFETLNSRGKDLKASDIIKNHIMSLMSSDLENANNLWNSVTKKLDDNSDRITRFIRTYWASKKRIVSESKLYRAIGFEIDNKNKAENFLKELKSLVELYTVLENPLTPKAHYEYFKNSNVIEYIDVLNRMHVLLYYPIILALEHNGFSNDDILKVTHKIIAIFIKHRTILNRGTNKLESGFSDVAQKIWKLEFKNVNSIILYLNNRLIPSNDQVTTSFSVLSKEGGQRGAKKWTLIYLLEEIYSATYNDFSDNDDAWYKQVFQDDNYRVVQISTDDTLGDYQNYIGNWILIEKNLSKKEYSNIDELKGYLKRSGLKGNKALLSILNNNSWSQENIKKRQQIFSEQILSIWI